MNEHINKERIKAIRNSLGLSQTAFGERIGVKIGVIRNLEDGVTQLCPPLFELFCKIYNVNPNWLYTGKGEMFLPNDNDTLSILQKQYGLSDNAIKLLENFVHMDKIEQDELVKILSNLASD